MIANVNALRTDKGTLERELVGLGARIRGANVNCPFHEDKGASGSMHSDDQGVYRFTCHATGCGFSGDIFDVQANHI